MPGLHSTRQNELAVSNGAASVNHPGPQLRVVTADSDGRDPACPMELFEAALGRGDLSRARDTLLAIREDQRAEQNRIELEKRDLLQAVEDLQTLLDERCRSHEQELLQQKHRLTEWHEAEKQALILESDEVASEIQKARECWEAERQEQAAILVEEQLKLEYEAEDLRRHRSELESQLAEIVEKRADQDEELKARRKDFDSELQAEQRDRIRAVDEAIAQRENEWLERQRQLDHQMDSQRQLHEKQLALDRESFLRACADREADLDAIRADVDLQRKELTEERCRSAEQFSETRRQLQQDRTLLQNGLRQMESQLRWVSASISINGGQLPRPENDDAQAADADSGVDRPPAAAVAATERTRLPGAESVFVAEEGDSGWLGVVSPRTAMDEAKERQVEVEPRTAALEGSATVEDNSVPVVPAPASTERRQKLEDYRSQLSSLQASLNDLQAGGEADAETE